MPATLRCHRLQRRETVKPCSLAPDNDLGRIFKHRGRVTHQVCECLGGTVASGRFGNIASSVTTMICPSAAEELSGAASQKTARPAASSAAMAIDVDEGTSKNTLASVREGALPGGSNGL